MNLLQFPSLIFALVFIFASQKEKEKEQTLQAQVLKTPMAVILRNCLPTRGSPTSGIHGKVRKYGMAMVKNGKKEIGMIMRKQT